MRLGKFSFLITGALCSLTSVAMATSAHNRDGHLAAEITKMQHSINMQNEELNKLRVKLSLSEVKNTNTAPTKSLPAKYVQVPNSNSGISFIVRPRVDLIYDQGQSPGDLMAVNTIPLKNIDPNAAPSRNSSMNARGTQLGFKTSAQTESGDEIKSHLEIDFYGNQTAGGANTVSNYDPRLRYAYLSFKGWMAGQTNSLWRDPETEGNIIDYQGSIGYVRQASLRYMHKWYNAFSTAIALERPLTDTMIRTGATTVTTETAPVTGFSSRSGKYGRAEMPDVIANIKYEEQFGHINLRGLYRNLKVNYSSGAQTYTPKKTGYGLGLAAKFNFYDKSNIFGQVNVGRGVGHYFLETSGQSAYLDVSTPGSESMKLVKSQQFVVGIQHFWDEYWQSNIIYTTTQSKAPAGIYFVPKTDSTTTRFNKQLDHIHLNTIWSVTKDLDVGMEYAYGKRKTFERVNSATNRFMLMMRYAF